MSENDLNEQNLREAVGSRSFRYYPVVDSTNDLAREWALSGAPDGALVIADEQRFGRGRFGRQWVAPAGTALLFSVILRPQIDPSRLPRMTMIGALAVSDALSSLPSLPLELISLKWPNDVLLGGRKVSGILSEAVWEVESGNRLEAVILGIGLNVRVDFTGTDYANQATSIERLTGTTVNRASLLEHVLMRIEHWLVRINERSLQIAWHGRLATIGQRISVQDWATRDAAGKNNRVITGLALDVEDDGTLLLRDDDGTIHRLVSGTVTLSGAG